MDLEQIILAVNKSNYKILPCGAAALAKGFSKTILPDTKYQYVQKTIPVLPKLVISGSATKLTSSQIRCLEHDGSFTNKYFVPLTVDNIMGGVTEEMVDYVCRNMGQSNIVTVYSSDIAINPDLDKSDLLIQGITKERFVSMITTYLAELTKRVLAKTPAILITLGGETSRKCCNAINSKVLKIVDAVEPAMPLCIDNNSQWIVTKSGNLGHGDTLVKILKYFEARQA